MKPADVLRPVGRWTAFLKRDLVEHVEAGVVPLDVALAYHGISLDEYLGWCDRDHQAGLRGLRAKYQPNRRLVA